MNADTRRWSDGETAPFSGAEDQSASGGPTPGFSPGEKQPLQIVDGHLHIGGPPERRGSVEDILALMGEHHIKRAVAFPAPGLRPDNAGLARTIAKYPDRFVGFAWINPHHGQMDHMGLQWMGYVDAAIRVAKRLPNVILGTSGMVFYTKIRQAVREVGADRVVFGSDAPMVHPGPEILRVQAAELTPDEERMVLRDNMLRLIKLSGR